MEALSSEKYSRVLPQYFEISMKVKYSVDDETAVIFDLIHDSMTTDFGYFFNNTLGGLPCSVFKKSMLNVGTLMSNVESNREALITEYENLVSDIQQNCK